MTLRRDGMDRSRAPFDRSAREETESAPVRAQTAWNIPRPPPHGAERNRGSLQARIPHFQRRRLPARISVCAGPGVRAIGPSGVGL